MQSTRIRTIAVLGAALTFLDIATHVLWAFAVGHAPDVPSRSGSWDCEERRADFHLFEYSGAFHRRCVFFARSSEAYFVRHELSRFRPASDRVWRLVNLDVAAQAEIESREAVLGFASADENFVQSACGLIREVLAPDSDTIGVECWLVGWPLRCVLLEQPYVVSIPPNPMDWQDFQSPKVIRDSYSRVYVDWAVALANLALVVLPVIACVELLFSVRSWSRRSQGRCSRCGYPLVAIPRDSPCPECGL